MKVLVISGFLGAGKTTFLRELARRTQRDFAIMENEYGEVGIDGGILGQAEEKLNIWELTEGCICCSMKSDFATSVLTIANTVDPEYLIVEPTGVGMLSKVLENLAKIQYERITLLSPVTVLDGRSWERYRKEFPDILLDQITAAGTIVFSKMEGTSQEERGQLKQAVREINPQARILSDHYTQMDDLWWNQLLETGLTGEIGPGGDRSTELENLGLTDISLETPDQLLLLLNGIVSGVFGKICRAKGYLKAGESWLRFDTADLTYSITGCAPMEDSRAVFIGRDIHRADLRHILQQEIRVTALKPKDRGRRYRAS